MSINLSIATDKTKKDEFNPINASEVVIGSYTPITLPDFITASGFHAGTIDFSLTNLDGYNGVGINKYGLYGIESGTPHFLLSATAFDRAGSWGKALSGEFRLGDDVRDSNGDGNLDGNVWMRFKPALGSSDATFKFKGVDLELSPGNYVWVGNPPDDGDGIVSGCGLGDSGIVGYEDDTSIPKFILSAKNLTTNGTYDSYWNTLPGEIRFGDDVTANGVNPDPLNPNYSRNLLHFRPVDPDIVDDEGYFNIRIDGKDLKFDNTLNEGVVFYQDEDISLANWVLKSQSNTSLDDDVIVPTYKRVLDETQKATSSFLGNFGSLAAALIDPNVTNAFVGMWFTVDENGGESYIVVTDYPSTGNPEYVVKIKAAPYFIGEYADWTAAFMDTNVSHCTVGDWLKITSDGSYVSTLDNPGDSTKFEKISSVYTTGDVLLTDIEDIDGQTFVGRNDLISGSMETLTYTEARAMLNVEDGADVTNADNIALAITGTTFKTPPVDADAIAITDSADNTLKKLSWSTVKATIKTDSDALYGSITDVALNTTHRSSNGTDHANVVLNDTHRATITGNPHAVTKADVGLGNVQDIDTTNASNISSGTLPSSVLPPVALTTVQVTDSEAGQLALTTEEGDVVVRSDENKSYMRNSSTFGTMADFTELQTPTDSVLSVNSQTGTVVLNTSHIAENTNLYYTDARVAANSAVALNTAKETNVPTNLSVGTRTSLSLGITSDGGTDDVILPASSTLYAGLMTKDQFDKLTGIEPGATADQTKADIDSLGINAALVNSLSVETAVPVGALFTDKQNTINNTLTSTSTTQSLSAAQGKVLQDSKEPADSTILKESDVDDTPVNGVITAPISSNWAYAHSTATNPHNISILSLGETSTTAYRGDRGKIAYDHSQVAHAPSTAEQNVQSDWDALSGDALILNKPTTITEQQVSDIQANNLKVSDINHNVTTNLSSTHNASTVVVNSSDGTNATINAATATTAGIMTEAMYGQFVSNTDKETNVVTNLSYTPSTTNGIVTSSDGTDATLPLVVASGNAGLMTGSDKFKLDNVETNANAYTLPTATSTVKGGVELFSNTVQNIASNAVSSIEAKTYGVQLNSSGQAVVNVPWDNTVYTHPTYTAFTESKDSGTLTGTTVISDLDFNITTNTLGHVTACDITTLSTRNLTLSDFGLTATSTELNYVDGVTSAIQTQLDSKISSNQTITLSGDATGSGTTSIVVTISDDSHNHIISNVDGLQTALDNKVDDSQVLTDVPAGALFTDHIYTDEESQDAVGSILVDSSEVNFTYNDTTPSITASLIAGSIDESKLDTSVNASLDLADSSLQTSGNLTESTSSVLTITNGTDAVVGSGTSIQVKQASTSTSGYLSSTDWNIFNGKMSDVIDDTTPQLGGGLDCNSYLITDAKGLSTSSEDGGSAFDTTNKWNWPMDSTVASYSANLFEFENVSLESGSNSGIYAASDTMTIRMKDNTTTLDELFMANGLHVAAEGPGDFWRGGKQQIFSSRDVHGIQTQSSVCTSINHKARGSAGIAAHAFQYGYGVAENDFMALNPSAAQGGVGAANGMTGVCIAVYPNYNHGRFLSRGYHGISIQNYNTSLYFSGDSNTSIPYYCSTVLTASGNFLIGLDLGGVLVADQDHRDAEDQSDEDYKYFAAIRMPCLTTAGALDENTENRILYDIGDYNLFNRSTNIFKWYIDDIERVSISKDTLDVSGTTSKAVKFSSTESIGGGGSNTWIIGGGSQYNFTPTSLELPEGGAGGIIFRSTDHACSIGYNDVAGSPTYNLWFYVNDSPVASFYSDYLSMESNQIKYMLDPTDNQDAATKKYVDDNIGSISHLTTNLDADGNNIYNASGYHSSSSSDTFTGLTIPTTWGGFNSNASNAITANIVGAQSNATYRDGLVIGFTDNDNTIIPGEENVIGGQKRFANGLRVGATSGVVGTDGWYTKDIVGVWSRAVAVTKSGYEPRGCSGIGGEAIQYGHGVATNELVAANPSSAAGGSAQAYQLQGVMPTITPDYGDFDEGDTTRQYDCIGAINAGSKEGSTILRGTGRFSNGIDLTGATISNGGIRMPRGTVQGSIIEYDADDYTQFINHNGNSGNLGTGRYDWRMSGDVLASFTTVATASSGGSGGHGIDLSLGLYKHFDFTDITSSYGFLKFSSVASIIGNSINITITAPYLDLQDAGGNDIEITGVKDISGSGDLDLSCTDVIHIGKRISSAIYIAPSNTGVVGLGNSPLSETGIKSDDETGILTLRGNAKISLGLGGSPLINIAPSSTGKVLIGDVDEIYWTTNTAGIRVDQHFHSITLAVKSGGTDNFLNLYAPKIYLGDTSVTTDIIFRSPTITMNQEGTENINIGDASCTTSINAGKIKANSTGIGFFGFGPVGRQYVDYDDVTNPWNDSPVTVADLFVNVKANNQILTALLYALENTGLINYEYYTP